MKKEKELPEDIITLRTHCIICYGSTVMSCGGWKAVTGGCCVGAEYNGARYLINLSAHLSCLRAVCGKVKTWYNKKELKTFIENVKKLRKRDED